MRPRPTAEQALVIVRGLDVPEGGAKPPSAAFADGGRLAPDMTAPRRGRASGGSGAHSRTRHTATTAAGGIRPPHRHRQGGASA